MSVVTLLPEGEQQRLDRYQLIGEIASGGMASVYLARLGGVAGFQRFVAIKRLHPHLAKEREFVEMFLDEARLAASIHHRNVVPILEIGTSRGGYYLVMEFIEGVTLARLMTQAAVLREPIPRPVLLRIIVDTLSGLHAAHELCDDSGEPLGVVHRDCSPQNILVGHDGCTRLTDFGIARARARMHNTREGAMKGKLAYMAPEQSQGEAFDRRADLFSVATVLWEVLAERRLFKGKTEAQTLRRLLHDPIPRLSEVMDGVHPELDAMVAKALSREPARRFTTAAEMADALEEAARAQGGADAIATERAVESMMQERYGGDFSDQREALRSWLQATPTMVGHRGAVTDRGWIGPTRSDAGASGPSKSSEWPVITTEADIIDEVDDHDPTRPARRAEILAAQRKPPPRPRRGADEAPPTPRYGSKIPPAKPVELVRRKSSAGGGPPASSPAPPSEAPPSEAPQRPASVRRIIDVEAPPKSASQAPAASAEAAPPSARRAVPSTPGWGDEGAAEDETHIYDPPSTTGMTGSTTVGVRRMPVTMRSEELPMDKSSHLVRWLLAALVLSGLAAAAVVAVRSGAWSTSEAAPAHSGGEASGAEPVATATTPSDVTATAPEASASAEPAPAPDPPATSARPAVAVRPVPRRVPAKKAQPPEPKVEPPPPVAPEPKPEPQPGPKPKNDDIDDLANPYR